MIAVVLYHADLVYGGRQWFGAGFLGVDAFFVLSGFLITALLLVEREQDGRISLREFWSRRARRLLPALFLVVGFVVLYAAFVAEQDELAQIRADGLASLFYVANWKFIADGTSYFDLFQVESPFQHLWSLAIEEQWYVFWPLVMVGVMGWRRASARTVMWLSLALALLSAAWAAFLFTSGTCWPLADTCDVTSRVYYGTGARAQSLLIGAALSAALISGLTVRDLTARYVVPAAASLAGLVVLVVWLTRTDVEDWYYRGGFLLMALLVALVILAAVQPERNPVRWALSIRPLAWLGLISYGIYLWHWPIFVFLSRRRAFLEGWSYEQITALRLATTLVVATASYYLVERPIRVGALGRRIRFSPALIPATAVLLVVLLVVTTTRPAGPSFDVPEAEAELELEALLDGSDRLPSSDELREGLDPATRPPPPTDRGPADTRVLIVGDSVAYSMAGGFTPEVQRNENLSVWNQTVLFCELAEGPRMENGEVVRPSNTCEGWRDAWEENVDEFAPEVAVLQVGAWEIFDRKVDGDWLAFGTPDYDEYFLGVVDDAIDSLAAGGATVVLLTSADFERSDTISAREWTQNETWRTQHINQLFREAAARHPSAVVIELGDWVCPDDCITNLADGRLAREDGIHFTDEGAETAARWLAPQLRSIGLAVNHRLPTADRAEPRASLRVEEELGEPAPEPGDPEPQPPDLGPEPTSRSES